MPAKVVITSAAYILAEERKLLDRRAKGRKKDANGKFVLERKSGRERLRIFARLCRELDTKDRESGQDVEDEDLLQAQDIVASDKHRAEMRRLEREMGFVALTSLTCRACA